MSDTGPGGELSRVCVLRFTERARRDLDFATVHFAETASPEIAVAWREGLYAALASLATLPRRCPLAPERFRREVRQMLYRRQGSHTAYRVLFTLMGEEETSPEAPTVVILHLRHASARPLTTAQARALERE